MLRTLSAVALGAALLGTSAIPATAAHAAAKPKVHTFTMTGVAGIKTWGSYYTAGGRAHVTLCVKETASNVDLAIGVATALNASASKHQDLSITITGFRKQVCRSMTSGYTAHLWAEATSGTNDGKAHVGKPKKIY